MSQDGEFTALLKKPLQSGGHSFDEGKQCVMERVSMLHALAIGRSPEDLFGDTPACTSDYVAYVAQCINDNLGDRSRQQLIHFVPRLLRTRNTRSDQDVAKKVAMRLALAYGADEQLIRDIESGWVRDATDTFYDRLVGVLNGRDADNLAAFVSEIVKTKKTKQEIVMLLDEFLDMWEEELVKAGEDLYVPSEWEDEALAFLASLTEPKDA